MTLDLILLVTIFVFTVLGYFSGFLMQVLRLVVLVGAYLLARPIGKALGPWIAAKIGGPLLLGQGVGVLIVFVILYYGLSTAGWILLRRRRKAKDPLDEGSALTWLRRSDRVLGAILAAAKILLILYVLLSGVVLIERQLPDALTQDESWLMGSFAAKFVRSHNLLAGLSIPMAGNLASLGRLGTDPAFRERALADPKTQALLQHPKIRSFLDDPALVAASQQGDILAILENPRLSQLIEDPEIQKLVSEVDLSGITSPGNPPAVPAPSGEDASEDGQGDKIRLTPLTPER